MSSYRLSVVIPVHNEDDTVLQEVVSELKTHSDWEVIVVDDGSKRPASTATLFLTPCQGYGAAIKAGVRHATAPLVATMDGDGQHRARDLERLAHFMDDFPECAMVIGDRRLKEPTFKRWMGRKVLNWMATFFAGRWIPDLNSGLRVFRRQHALGYEPILCDKFSYTTSLAMTFLTDGHKVDWVPIRVHPRVKGSSRVQLWKDGWRTLCLIVWIGGALRTRNIRNWLRERKTIL